MNSAQLLILALYLLCAGALLIFGYVWKEIRNSRKRNIQKSFPFGKVQPPETEAQKEQHHLASARH